MWIQDVSLRQHHHDDCSRKRNKESEKKTQEEQQHNTTLHYGFGFFSRPPRGGPWLILGTPCNPPPLPLFFPFPFDKNECEMGIKACCTMRIIVWHVNLDTREEEKRGLVYIIVWFVGLFV
jgi:hypothetical protein